MADPLLELDTARLRLSPLSPADLASFHATNTEAFVRRYLLAATDEANRDSARLCIRLGFGLVEERVIDGSLTHFYRMENRD